MHIYLNIIYSFYILLQKSCQQDSFIGNLVKYINKSFFKKKKIRMLSTFHCPGSVCGFFWLVQRGQSPCQRKCC